MQKEKLKEAYHRFNKKIKDNPYLLKINLALVPIAKYFYFSNERKVIRGKNISTSNSTSVIFFTAHKCASTFLDGIFEKLGKPNKVVPIHLPNYLPGADEDYKFDEKNFMLKTFNNTGYYYGAFRKYHEISNIEKYKVVLVLRDPRDILTSLYFSAAFNHPVSRKVNIENRKNALKQTIDEFVLEHALDLKKNFDYYIYEIIPLQNSIFLKYEEMITNFDKWLPKLVEFIEWDNTKDVMNKIIDESSFTVKKEDKNSFVRNIKAGDHIDKLKPETITSLNKVFGDSLIKLGYKI